MDLGIVSSLGKRPFTFRVQNSSSEDVHVEKLVTSCSCTSIYPAEFELRQNESILVNAKIDFSRVSKSKDLISPFGVEVRFDLGENKIQEFYFSGQVKKPFVLPAVVNRFEKNIQIGEKSKTLQLRFIVDPDVEKFLLVAKDQNLTVKNVRSEKSSLERIEMWDCELSPQFHIGEFSYPLDVRAEFSSEGKNEVAQIWVNGRVESDLDYSPRQLLFYLEPDKQKIQSETVRVFSDRKRKFRVVNVLSSHPSIVVNTPTSQQERSEHEVNVSIGNNAEAGETVQGEVQLTLLAQDSSQTVSATFPVSVVSLD